MRGVPPVKLPRPSPTQRSSTPQVHPSLDRCPFVTEKCLALKQKNGSRFSKEELNYWLKCPLSMSSQESHQLRKEHKGIASHRNWAWRPTVNGHCVPANQGMASRRNWAWRPTIIGHCVPANQGIASQFGMQSMSPNLGTVWSGHSFLTDAQSNGEDRLLQPPTGSKIPRNGKPSPGMSRQVGLRTAQW